MLELPQLPLSLQKPFLSLQLAASQRMAQQQHSPPPWLQLLRPRGGPMGDSGGRCRLRSTPTSKPWPLLLQLLPPPLPPLLLPKIMGQLRAGSWKEMLLVSALQQQLLTWPVRALRRMWLLRLLIHHEGTSGGEKTRKAPRMTVQLLLRHQALLLRQGGEWGGLMEEGGRVREDNSNSSCSSTSSTSRGQAQDSVSHRMGDRGYRLHPHPAQLMPPPTISPLLTCPATGQARASTCQLGQMHTCSRAGGQRKAAKELREHSKLSQARVTEVMGRSERGRRRRQKREMRRVARREGVRDLEVV